MFVLIILSGKTVAPYHANPIHNLLSLLPADIASEMVLLPIEKSRFLTGSSEFQLLNIGLGEKLQILSNKSFLIPPFQLIK